MEMTPCDCAMDLTRISGLESVQIYGAVYGFLAEYCWKLEFGVAERRQAK